MLVIALSNCLLNPNYSSGEVSSLTLRGESWWVSKLVLPEQVCL